MNPNQNKVVLQINSIDVLERLIGGDGEVEIDIRNNIVQEFARRHLKPLANTPEIRDFANSVKKAAADEAARLISAQIGTFKSDGYRSSLSLNTETKNIISGEVDKVVRDLIRTESDAALVRWAPEAIQKLIDQRVDADVKLRVSKLVDAKLDEIRNSL